METKDYDEALAVLDRLAETYRRLYARLQRCRRHIARLRARSGDGDCARLTWWFELLAETSELLAETMADMDRVSHSALVDAALDAI